MHVYILEMHALYPIIPKCDCLWDFSFSWSYNTEVGKVNKLRSPEEKVFRLWKFSWVLFGEDVKPLFIFVLFAF